MVFKFLLFNFLFFFLASGAMSAVRVPVTLTGRSGVGGRQFFVIGLPLKQGEISDLKHLQLTDEKGEEIAIQTSLISSWPDGSCRWVRICGLLEFAPGGERRVAVELGNDVLRSVPRGIIKAESSNKMLIDAGRLTVQLRTDRLSLPDRISMDGIDLGTFAPFKSTGGIPEFELIEAGPIYMIVEIRDSRGIIPLRYRLHFLWNEPVFMVESIGQHRHNRDDKVHFINWKEFSFNEKWQKDRALFCYGFDRLPVLSIEPLTGIIDRRELENRAILCSGRDLPHELKLLEQQLLEYAGRNPAAVPPETLSGAFFRTGDVNFLQIAIQRFNERRHDAPEELIAHCPGWPPVKPPVSKAPSRLPGELYRQKREITTAEAAAFLIPDGRLKEIDENFIRWATLLLQGFDPAAAGWFARLDLRGGPVRSGHAGLRLNLRLIRIMLKMASVSDNPAWEKAALTALKHLSICQLTPSAAVSPELFALLAESGAYFRQHPAALKSFPAKSLTAILPERSQYDLTLKADKDFSATVVPAAGQTVTFRAKLSNDTAGEKLALFSPDDRLLAQIPSDRSGRFEFNVPGTGIRLQPLFKRPQFCTFKLGGDHIFKLPFTSSPWHFKDLRTRHFRIRIDSSVKPVHFRLRALAQGEYAELILISPAGRQYRLSDRNPDGESILLAPELIISGPETGIWQMRLISSGTDFVLSATGAEGGIEY